MWYLTIFDKQGLGSNIPFNLVEGRSTLIIAMDIDRFGRTNTVRKRGSLELWQPLDKHKSNFITYIANDENGDEKTWLDIVLHRKSCIKSLMSNITKLPEINLVNNVHRLTHGNLKDLTQLFTEAGMMTEKIQEYINRVPSSCIPCYSSLRLKNTKILSVKNFAKEINNELQADFLTIKI